MYIKSIKIRNFRNIENCFIFPKKRINVICGENAQGKTNLIESIYYSSIFKSFKTSKNINLINRNHSNFSIDINVLNNNVESNLKIYLDSKKGRKIVINNKNPDKLIYKNLNTVIYYPDEISLLKNNPAYRRNLIDKSIFFINNEYVIIYRNYIKILKQRNIFLKNQNYKDDIWKDQLIEYAYKIIKERISYINKINSDLYKFSKDEVLNEIYSIKYTDYDIENIKDYLNKKFIDNKEKEKKYGYTLIGPHIEDFKFYINDHDINKYSSEGQKRSLLLSFKHAQILDYKDKFGYYPVLLLDDVGTELDNIRKNKIYNKLLTDSGQVFVTTVDLPDIFLNKSSVYKVNNGKFLKLEFD